MTGGGGQGPEPDGGVWVGAGIVLLLLHVLSAAVGLTWSIFLAVAIIVVIGTLLILDRPEK